MSSIHRFLHAALDRIKVSDEMRHLMTSPYRETMAAYEIATQRVTDAIQLRGF